MAWARERVARALAQGGPERVVAVLVGSEDLVAAVDGRTAGLSSEADRAIMRAWREVADVLLVGTGTLMSELYSGAIVSQDGRERRTREGRPPLPPILTVDRSGSLDVDVALRGDDPPPLIVYVGTGCAGSDPRVTWVELPSLSLDRVLEDVRGRLDARLIVTEGGPKLLQAALEQGVVTDMSLTIAPIRLGSGPRLFATESEPPHVELLPAEVIDGCTFAHWDLTGAS